MINFKGGAREGKQVRGYVTSIVSRMIRSATDRNASSVTIAFEPAQPEVIELPVRAGAVPDDRQRVTQFGLAAKRPGILGEILDQRRQMIVDVDAFA